MEKIEPKVDQIWEIREIAEDFTNPLEVFREAISNAYDAKADEIKIELYKAKEGEYKYSPFIIKISDNGKGMTKEEIIDFWSLGRSYKRKNKEEFIGCKGHGTMIYLKAKYIQIQTTNENSAYKSFCVDPMHCLLNNKFYEPQLEKIERSKDGTGTEIILEGYIEDETAFSKRIFKYEDIKDYIEWFTKHGSIEKEFGYNERAGCKLELKVFDKCEKIEFGHKFAEINSNIEKLKKEHKEYLTKHYVKKYTKTMKLEGYPNYNCEMVVYFEGEEARKQSNEMLKNSKYTESSRYGIYLCKDYIPIIRVNSWIKGFYGGSNGYVRLHGFINCQEFKLTANRGSVTLSNQDVMKELEHEVDKFIKEIDKDLTDQGLKKYEEEIKAIQTLEEKNAYNQRRKNIEEKEIYKVGPNENSKIVYIPENETELFYIYTKLSTLYPNEFPFEPMDYNATKGIDMLVKTGLEMYGRESYAYVELKRTLDNRVPFNHSFLNLAYILCWEVSEKVEIDSEFYSKIDGKDKKWIYGQKGDKTFLYDSEGSRINIEIIELKKIFDKYAEKQ